MTKYYAGVYSVCVEEAAGAAQEERIQQGEQGVPSSEQVFEDRTFEGPVFCGLEPAGKGFSGCVFKKCDMSGLRFGAAVFTDCVFFGCNLAHTKVDGCRFRNVTFEECKLVGVVFSRVNHFLLEWVFKKCKIELCSFEGLRMKGSKFLECAVRETDFTGADLSGADFSGSDLHLSRFHRTILEKADLSLASHFAIDPSANRLKLAKFSYPEVLSLLSAFEIKIE